MEPHHVMMSQQGHHFKMHRTAIVALFLLVATESRNLKSESKVSGVATALKAYFENNEHRLISRNHHSECEKLRLEANTPKYRRCKDIFVSAINLQPVSDGNITTYCIDECYKYIYIAKQLIRKCPDYYPVVSRSNYLCNTRSP